MYTRANDRIHQFMEMDKEKMLRDNLIKLINLYAHEPQSMAKFDKIQNTLTEYLNRIYEDKVFFVAVGDANQKDFATSHNEDITLKTDQITAIAFSMPKELYTSLEDSKRVSFMNAAALYTNNQVTPVANSSYQAKLDSML